MYVLHSRNKNHYYLAPYANTIHKQYALLYIINILAEYILGYAINNCNNILHAIHIA